MNNVYEVAMNYGNHNDEEQCATVKVLANSVEGAIVKAKTAFDRRREVYQGHFSFVSTKYVNCLIENVYE
jgi:hypothetical protein